MAQSFFRRGIPGVLPSAWVITPETPKGAPPLLAIHGLNRETEVMADLLTPQADVAGRTVVLPVFDRRSWPRFQRAACQNRSDWALLSLLRVLRAEGWIGAATPDISGFSGGAQFAHRFAWLYPELFGRLCLVAPGWWTFPEEHHEFPMGIGSTNPKEHATVFRLRANLRRFLDRDIHVTVGALDVVPDRNLRQDPAIVAQQGPHRVQRARNWTAAAIRTARQHNLNPRISFEVMENCGHSFADCIANGQLVQTFVPGIPSQTFTQPMVDCPHLEEVA